MVNSAQKRALKIGIASIALGIAGFFGSAFAHADTILLPGHADGDCWGYVAQLGDDQTGVVPPGTTPLNLPPGVSCANYSAQMSPIGGEAVNTTDSTNEGAQRAHDICADVQDRRPGAQCTFRAFSEGTIAGAKVQWREINEGNTHTNLVTDGDAIGSTNILKGWIVQNPFVGPIACSNPDGTNVPFSINPLGIPCLDAPPNTDRSFSKYDPFANGNQPDPLAILPQVLSPEHAVQNPNDPHVDWQGPNGEINHEYDVDGNGFVADNIPAP